MNVTIKDLLEAGLHFGHQLRRYNPQSKKFIFDNRHGISIIDLEKSYACLQAAASFVEQTVAKGKNVLFVGTKKQAQEIIREAAVSCSMPFTANRWMGGTLTNWTTIKRSIDKYNRYLNWESDGTLDKMHNKEASAIRREMERMNRNFEGIREMPGLPSAMFVIDTRNEAIAVNEANRLKIPVIGLVDTNSDPSVLDFPIPGNDDSIKSIRLIVEVIADAVQNGLAHREMDSSGGLRHIAPIVPDNITEEQLPVTIPTRDEEDLVPDSYSTDE